MDFSDRALVAGTVVGVRSFRVDNYFRADNPRLLATQVDYAWEPGDNVAQCLKGDLGRGYMPASPLGYWATITPAGRFVYYHRVGSALYQLDEMTGMWNLTEEQPEPEPDHRAARLDCSCGFYAYFDGGTNPYYHANNHVIGLIEGWGAATVGRRGFRVENARIVALVIPPPDHYFLQNLVQNYPAARVYPTEEAAIEAHPPTPLASASDWTKWRRFT